MEKRRAIAEKEIRLVKLRLKRTGRKGRPFYRIVAIHSTLPRGGRSLSQVGTYDPVHSRVEVDEEAAVNWRANDIQVAPQSNAVINDARAGCDILFGFTGGGNDHVPRAAKD